MTEGQLDQRTIDAARERHALSRVIGTAVALKRRGKELIGLCPFHQEQTPSFTVRDDKGFFHCFGCGAHGDAIGWRMKWHRESFVEAVTALSGGADLKPSPAPDPKKQARQREDEERDRRRRMEIAGTVWHEAWLIDDTPGERYLRVTRGITIKLPPTLRYHPSLVYGPKEDRVRLPGIVAAVQRVGIVGVPAVHRIFLDPATINSPAPRKTSRLPDKALLGEAKGGAIRFTPWQRRMRTCEGPETGLSILQALPDLGLWCGIDATHMTLIEWPRETDALTIFGDRDPVSMKPGSMQGKRPGEEAAAKAARNFLAGRAARYCDIAVPPGEKADFNDLLLLEEEVD